MTTTTEHDEVLPLLAGEVLGGLDADERGRLAAHRRRCDRCADEAVALSGLIVDPRVDRACSVAIAIARVSRGVDRARGAGTRGRTDAGPGDDDRRRLALAPSSAGGRPHRDRGCPGGDGSRCRDRDHAPRRCGRGPRWAYRRSRRPCPRPGPARRRRTRRGRDGRLRARFDGFCTVIATGLAATPSGRVYQLWAADADGFTPWAPSHTTGQVRSWRRSVWTLGRQMPRWSPSSPQVARRGACRARRSCSASCRPGRSRPSAHPSPAQSVRRVGTTHVGSGQEAHP